MINAKVKLIRSSDGTYFEKTLNEFLETIDTRQIIKTDFSTTCNTHNFYHSAIIYYVGIDDVRDAKIDNILEIK